MDSAASEADQTRYPPSALLTRLLRDVSRTFYWTMRVLPRSIRDQIGLAYLLARTTDTIADTEIASVEKRLQALRWLRKRIVEESREAFDVEAFISPTPQSEISNLKSQIPNSQSQISNLKSQIPNLKSEISNLKSQISNLKSQISNLKSQISNVKSEISNLKSEIPPTTSATPRQPSTAERMLLERLDHMLARLNQFPPGDQQLIRDLLAVITTGQELDLQRFGAPVPGQIRALDTAPDLDDYTYRVAGCVGEFWTRLCRAHLFPNDPLPMDRLLANGVRFGKGLQLVNILRDLPADLRLGRCYIPARALAEAQLTPQDLLEPATEPRFRPLYGHFLDLAQEHLAAGWEYTNMLPRRCPRVRLACAWPILIGLKTLSKLRAENVLDPARRVKISRAEVKRLMARSVLALAWPPAWRRLPARV